MTRINTFPTILLVIINTTTIWGQPSQVGIIDFYGTISNEAELRKCLPFTTNDTVQFLTEASYPKAKKAIGLEDRALRLNLVFLPGQAGQLHHIIDGLSETIPHSRVVEFAGGHAPHIVSTDKFISELEKFQTDSGK